ncbi:hypothetical protein [Ruegeria marina]|uniref:Uncharacterized protein n=1 Tax=Ruegeria marina TaxID=639004 RepID=A0A1G7AZE0_9RHOB|nr:hypothetical protein [Ruegeria marina]SDE20153.1 hypothetical protein SAMN04488239_115107 [Ruegeria marina]
MVQVFLDAVAIRFYRGIGGEMQRIGPFSAINFFVGANNAGLHRHARPRDLLCRE